MTQALIDTLHEQHREIGRIVESMTHHLAVSDLDGVRADLARLKTALLAHLAIEDAHLYPALSHAAAAKDLAVAARVAVTYERNMEHVSEALRAFLEQYGGEHIELADLRRDWALVARMLIDRIESEEDQLYPLYRSWVLDEP